MKRLAVLAFLLLAAAPQPRRVLFIGNSLTYVNDLPAMLKTVAQSQHTPIETTFSGDAGMTLRQHWDKGEAYGLIRDGHYDFVVLQPQSSEAIADPRSMQFYARLFADAIRDRGAKPVIFCTWSPRPWNARQDEYVRNYIALARQIKAINAPVGIAWTSVAKHDVALYKDDVHPTIAGTYLAACTFFGAITGDSPIGASHPDGIDDATASLIQREAWAAVRRWR